MLLPEIPDEAFPMVARRVYRFLDQRPEELGPERTAAANRFVQSIGLRGQRDKRAWDLASVLLAAGGDVDIPALQPRELEAAVTGLTYGLMLAAELGWEPPLVESKVAIG